MALFLFSVLLAFGVSGICSLLEAVVLSLTPSQVAEMSMQRPRVGVIWNRFKTEIDRPIAAILILNTSAHTIGATVAGSQFEAIMGGKWILVFSLVFTYVMLQFTEILPKTLGVRYNRQFAPAVAVLLTGLVKILSPVVSFVRMVNRPFEGKGEFAHGPRALEEIAALAGLARISNLISPREERIIREASRLSETSVRNVMVPLEQITMLSTSQSLMDAIVTAHMDPHTRFPICEENDPNRVSGYINFKEMIYRVRTNPADPSLLGIIRPVHFTTPDETLDTLLMVFVEQHEHIAIVREGDRTLGLVTLEDIVEELVGELGDEFDRLPKMCHALSGGIWMVGGGLPVTQLETTLDTALPEPKGTVSAWLIERLGEVPARNTVHEIQGITFMIRRTRRGKIFEVSVSTHGALLPLAQ